MHITSYGIVASSKVEGSDAVLTAQASIINDGKKAEGFIIVHQIVDANGNAVGITTVDQLSLKPTLSGEYFSKNKNNQCQALVA